MWVSMTTNLESCVYNCYYEKILLTTIRLEKKEKLFIQNTIYNSCQFKKHLI